MTLADYLQELLYPARSAAILMLFVTLFLVFGLVALLGMISPLVAIGLTIIALFVFLPGTSRYLMHVTESRAANRTPEPATVDMFSLFGGSWSLLPLLLLIAANVGLIWLRLAFGEFAATSFTVLFALVLPAIVAVLAISHSIVESINPAAWKKFVLKVGPAYAYACLTALLIIALPAWLTALPALLASAIQLYFVFALFVVCGALIHKEGLLEEIVIPMSQERAEQIDVANLEKQRSAVLNHAYGFISRDNRNGGLEHIYTWLEQEPDMAAGWAWFYERAMQWERTDAALVFAQQYLKRLLLAQEPVRAVKLILRCRMLDERFKPLPEDRPAAIEAARNCNNPELVSVLERR